MARQVVKPNAALEIPSLEEIAAIVGSPAPPVTKIRAPGTVALDANGNGQDEVYKVPFGMEFEARRVMLNLSTATSPSQGNVDLGVSGLPGVSTPPTDQRTIAIANPAAGQDWSVAVPPNAYWRVFSVIASLQTSPAVATRLAMLRFSGPGGATIGLFPPATGQPTTQGPNPYTYAPGLTTVARVGTQAGTGQGIGIPELWLPPGSTIGTSTLLLDAADQWSGIELQVEEFTPSLGNAWIAYKRSGILIEYGAPQSPSGAVQVPGVQAWGSEQGPYLRNGEVFEVQANGLTPNASLIVSLAGILTQPRS